jgi:hypothetical protein
VFVLLVGGCFLQKPPVTPPAPKGLGEDTFGPCLQCGEIYNQPAFDAVGFDGSKPMFLYYCWEPLAADNPDFWLIRTSAMMYWDDASNGEDVLALPYGRSILDTDGDGDLDDTDRNSIRKKYAKFKAGRIDE